MISLFIEQCVGKQMRELQIGDKCRLVRYSSLFIKYYRVVFLSIPHYGKIIHPANGVYTNLWKIAIIVISLLLTST